MSSADPWSSSRTSVELKRRDHLVDRQPNFAEGLDLLSRASVELKHRDSPETAGFVADLDRLVEPMELKLEDCVGRKCR